MCTTMRLRPSCRDLAVRNMHVLRTKHSRPMSRPAVESPERAGTSSSHDPAKYAVLDLNGLRQVVEEGHAYTCSKAALHQLPGTSTLLFQNVMALRDGGRFVTGKPYVADATVEAELVEEFTGPIPSVQPEFGCALSPAATTLAKYRVTRIRAH